MFGSPNPFNTLVCKSMHNSSFAKSFGLPKWKQWLFALASQKITRKGAKQGQVYHFLFVQANSKQLQHAADILSTRNYHPSLDGVYKLEDAEKVFEHIASGHSQGKTIIEI